jgi:phage protein D
MGERPLSDFAVYRARPTVRVNGAEQAKLSELVLAMTMTESEGGMSALELKVSNFASDAQGGAGLAFEDERIVKLGSEIAVYGGDESSPREIFRGLVTGLEAEFSQSAPPELTILAEDACQRARMSRRTRTYRDMSVGDVAREIAQELGLTPVINGYGDPVGTWVQLNESDLAFLRRLLARHDGDLQVAGNELQVAPRSEVRRNAIDLALFGQLMRVRVLADLSGQVTEATTAGWDAEQGQRTSAASSGASLGPGRGRTGAQALEEALGSRSEHIGHLAATTSQEATGLADAMFDQRARGFVRLEGTAEGNPSLRIGTHVTISGVSPRFDNTYYVTRACHRFNLREGYRTTFNAECAYLGAAA